jgi:pimeloyl-ACP methyl ester carboxylesterase
VIATEQMGHGRTADLLDRPFHYHHMAEDTVGLMRQLGIESAVVVGYSDRGILGLDMAIHHPGRVTKLAVTGANSHTDGYTAENLEWVRTFDPDDLPASEAYARLSPDGVHAQVADIRIHQRTGRLRQQHLPAVADSGDPRALVDVEADVTLLGQPRLARVQPHPHPYRPVGKCTLAVRGGGDGARRAGECDEQRVTLCVDLDALVVGKRRAETPPMLLQRLPVILAE